MGSLTVLVIGAEIEKQLAPFRNYHESGCIFDEHVINVDFLQRASTDYCSTILNTYILSPAGERLGVFDDRFWRDETAAESLAGCKPSTLQNALTSGVVMSVFRHAPGEKSRRVRRVLELPPAYVPSESALRVLELPPAYVPSESALRETVSLPDFLKTYYGLHRVAEGDMPDLKETHKAGWFRTDGTGAVVEVISRDVPKKWVCAWFSWSVGYGDGELAWKLVPGAVGSSEYEGETAPGHAYSAQKGAIDFTVMRSNIATPAARLWDSADKGECHENFYEYFPHSTSWMVNEAQLALPKDQFIQGTVDKILHFDLAIMAGERVALRWQIRRGLS